MFDHQMRRLLTVLRLIAAFAIVATISGESFAANAADTDTTIRLSLNPNVYNNLPIFLAIDRGYFSKRHLNVEVSRISASSGTLIPLLARGDVDIAPIVVSPAFFNQFSTGFNLKILASISSPHTNWGDTVWFVVRQDLWDDARVRTLADLKGKAVDGGQPGAPIDFFARQALIKAGFSMTDVHYSNKARQTADTYALLRNKAVDIVTTIEPVASQLEAEKLGHRWISYRDVIPWYQDSYIVASSAFLRDHRNAVVRFIEGCLEGQRDVVSAGPKWTPDLAAEVAKWSEMPPDVIARIQGPAYTGEMGSVLNNSISRQQDLWLSLNLVSKSVTITDFEDLSLLAEARRSLGIRR